LIDLHATLARLDTLARDPAALGEDDCVELRALQYALHRASEAAVGFAPPEDRELEHDELADALAEARDMTAEIADALEHRNADAAAALVWEWRGALFRVRFARLRLDRPRTVPAPPALRTPDPHYPPAVAAGAVALGSVLLLLAALLGLWLLVAMTLVATLAASVLLHP